VYYSPYICSVEYAHYHCKWCKTTIHNDKSNFLKHLNRKHLKEFSNFKISNGFIPSRVILENNNETVMMNKSIYSSKIYIQMIKSKFEGSIPIYKLKETIVFGQKIQSPTNQLVQIPTNISVFNHLNSFFIVQQKLDKNFIKKNLKNGKLNIISDHSKKFKTNLHSIIISFFKNYTNEEIIEQKKGLQFLLNQNENKKIKKQISNIE
jgi:hypothetical protein